MFLDLLVPSYVKTQFELGTNGYLGVRDFFVTHKKKFYANAIGAHAPSCVEYTLDGSYNTFEAEVAINDIESEETCNPVNFSVYADDRLVAYIPRVRAHESSRSIIANIDGATTLRLKADVLYDSYNNWCQSVWLLPQVHQEKNMEILSATRDCKIILKEKIIKSDRCIFTSCHANMIDDLSRMLKSLVKHNDISDIPIVVFAFGNINKFDIFKENYSNLIIVDSFIAEEYLLNKSIIAALTVHNIVDANNYLYLSPQMLILDNIIDVFSLSNYIDNEKILLCTNSITNIVGNSLRDIISYKESVYGGQGCDYEALRLDGLQQYYSFIINADFFCLSQKALLALEQLIKEMMPLSLKWKISNPKLAELREHALINCAIAKIAMGVELSQFYNYQVADNNIENIKVEDDVVLTLDNQRIKALYMNDAILNNFPQLSK